MYISPEAFILNPLDDSKDISTFEVTIKTILFDGANTKLSTLAEYTNLLHIEFKKEIDIFGYFFYL